MTAHAASLNQPLPLDRAQTIAIDQLRGGADSQTLVAQLVAIGYEQPDAERVVQAARAKQERDVAEAQAFAAGVRSEPEGNGAFFAPERAGIRMGAVGGVLMIVIALVWFFAGLAADIVFFYPPILFLVGVYALIKGLLQGPS